MLVFEIPAMRCSKTQLRDILFCIINTIYTHSFHDMSVKIKEYILFDTIVCHILDLPKLQNYISHKVNEIIQKIKHRNTCRVNLSFYEDFFLSFCSCQPKPILTKWKLIFDFTPTPQTKSIRTTLFELISTTEKQQSNFLTNNSKIICEV